MCEELCSRRDFEMNLTDKTDARANGIIGSETTWIKTFFRLIKIGLNKGGDI